MNETRNRVVIRCLLELDETGVPEEFTNDLDYLAKSDDISPLSSDGLPKVPLANEQVA